MSYNLWVEGERDVDRFARLFNKQTRAHEPLSGLVDSVNQYFYTQFTPILTSGSVGLYTSGSIPVASSQYTLDYDAGLFYLNTAPSVQPSATYQTAKYPEMTIRSILVAGFDEMEGRWFRGMALSSAVGNVVLPITEDSTAAYITNSSGSNPALASGLHFGDSRAQVNFYTKCVQLAFYRALMGETALASYIWAESGGLKVDKSMNTKNLKLAYDTLDKDLVKAMLQAQFEWYGDVLFGAGIAPLYTSDFVAHRWWQKDSAVKDYRNTTPYRGERW